MEIHGLTYRDSSAASRFASARPALPPRKAAWAGPLSFLHFGLHLRGGGTPVRISHFREFSAWWCEHPARAALACEVAPDFLQQKVQHRMI